MCPGTREGFFFCIVNLPVSYLNRDGGEEVLEIDAAADDERRRENVLEIRSLLVVRERIVRRQKHTAIEEAA